MHSSVPFRAYSGEGENIGTRKGVVELLELVVILLFWFFHTPVKIYSQAFAAPACPNTSPLPLVLPVSQRTQASYPLVRSESLGIPVTTPRPQLI